MEESEKETGKQREEEDKEKIQKIIAENVGIGRKVEIKQVIRLGRRNEEGGEGRRMRPLLIKLEESEDKYMILKSARNLNRAAT